MSKVFESDQKQDYIVKQVIESDLPGAINGSGTGAGKTVCSIRSGLGRGAERVLVIGQPKVMSNFRDTLKALSGIDLRVAANSRFRDVPVKEARLNKEAVMSGEPGWYYVSRELFASEMFRKREVKHRSGRTSMKKEIFRSWDAKKPFDFLIYDEVQMAASPATNSCKALRHVRSKFKYVMSGDWFGGDIGNQYHVAKTMWKEWMTSEYNDFNDWVDSNCTTKYDHFAHNKMAITGELIDGMFAASLPLYVRIPSPIEKPVPDKHVIELSPKERKLYNDLRRNMAAEVDGELFVVQHAHTLFARLREANLGIFRPVDAISRRRDAATGKMEDVDVQTIEFSPGDESSTVTAVREIMDNHKGEPVIVLTHSNKFANKAAVDLGGLAYTGSQTDREKAEAERAFMSGEINVLVGTDAMCEGLDGLQAVCRIAIIASRPGKNYMTPQFLGRIARRGQEREPQAYEIVRAGTLDEVIMVNRKENPGVVERAIMKELMLTGAKAL